MIFTTASKSEKIEEMQGQIANLVRFPLPEEDSPSMRQVRIQVTQQGWVLTLRFSLVGDWGGIVLPPLSDASTRRDRLWESTCFEGFWAVQGSKAYWELNLSPSGDWNVYAFDEYRTGMRWEDRISGVQFRRGLHSKSDPDVRDEIQVVVDLAPLFSEASVRPVRLDLGMTAVLAHQSGEKSYWALSHAGEKPDFHLRNSFIIQLG